MKIGDTVMRRSDGLLGVVELVNLVQVRFGDEEPDRETHHVIMAEDAFEVIEPPSLGPTPQSEKVDVIDLKHQVSYLSQRYRDLYEKTCELDNQIKNLQPQGKATFLDELFGKSLEKSLKKSKKTSKRRP